MRKIWYRLLIMLGIVDPETLPLLLLHEIYKLPDYVGKITEVSRDLKSSIDSSYIRGRQQGINEVKSGVCKKCKTKIADLLNEA